MHQEKLLKNHFGKWNGKLLTGKTEVSHGRNVRFSSHLHFTHTHTAIASLLRNICPTGISFDTIIAKDRHLSQEAEGSKRIKTNWNDIDIDHETIILKTRWIRDPRGRSWLGPGDPARPFPWQQLSAPSLLHWRPYVPRRPRPRPSSQVRSAPAKPSSFSYPLSIMVFRS